ncbi:MAG: hypothetical protein KDD38_10040 [Bdellovibrionales bacterium]|nr:hypothetical protein [Bdellovibrionales bacterium]
MLKITKFILLIFTFTVALSAALLAYSSVSLADENKNHDFIAPSQFSHKVSVDDILLSIETGTTLAMKTYRWLPWQPSHVDFLQSKDFNSSGLVQLGTIPIIIDSKVTALELWATPSIGDKNSNQAEIYIKRQIDWHLPPALDRRQIQISNHVTLFSNGSLARLQSDDLNYDIAVGLSTVSFAFSQIHIVLGYDEQTTIYSDRNNLTFDQKTKNPGPYISFDFKL